MNAIALSVCLMLALSLMRMNVVLALIISALVGGLIGGLSLNETVTAFNAGLGGGATIALSYAMLGTFAATLSKAGLTTWLAQHVVTRLGGEGSTFQLNTAKAVLISAILLMSISSQNLIPIHIAFIPILIPPLLHLFAQLKLDRRAIACVLTFGLVTPYMILPVGFGGIFLNEILLSNLNSNGLDVAVSDVAPAMTLPALGMVCGLLVAVFITYRKPREYQLEAILKVEPESANVSQRALWTSLVAIVAALILQLITDSIILGSLSGLVIFKLGGVIKPSQSQDLFTQGVKMMGTIGFIMISAAGFAAVMKATGHVDLLVSTIEGLFGDSKAFSAFMMLLVGLMVTMGIGSSFSTIPVIATIYVPLCLSLGFSPAATIAIIGTSAALGDAGSPASDSTLGPTAGLNTDGQHDHIWDSVVPTFIHYNIPLLLAGWVAAVVL